MTEIQGWIFFNGALLLLVRGPFGGFQNETVIALTRSQVNAGKRSDFSGSD